MSDEIYKILHGVQQSLKAPKGQTNSFGGYKYRSCEDIVEAVKPLLKDSGASLILMDEMIQLGDRYYIKATAAISLGSGAIQSTAYAREPAIKKGMDESQITGAASSYARKYALNGLFAIDDTKDADTMNNAQPVVKIDLKQKKAFVEQVNAALENADENALTELWGEWDTDEKTVLWAEFNSQQRSIMKKLMKGH